MSDLNYWDRLKVLKIHSIERRRERFIIIYMFKILNHLVPNPGVSFRRSERQGKTATVPLYPTSLSYDLRRLRFKSFNFVGPKLFNVLPKDLREFSSDGSNIVLAFKNKLDQFLSTIPDQPTVQGLQRAANSNSIIDQLNYKMSDT